MLQACVFTGGHAAEQMRCVQVLALPQKRRPLQSTRSWTAHQLKENPSPLDFSWQVIPFPKVVLVRWSRCCGWSDLSPAGYDLTPTMRDVNKKFSVRYFLNLVLVDEEDRRYFKQQVQCRVCVLWNPICPIYCVNFFFFLAHLQEIVLWRKAPEKLRKRNFHQRYESPELQTQPVSAEQPEMWVHCYRLKAARHTPSPHCWTARGVKAGIVWKHESTQSPAFTPSYHSWNTQIDIQMQL